MIKGKILVFNISIDSSDTSLGFAISWLNKFSEFYEEIDVVTLHLGDTSNLNNNVNIHSVISKNSNKFVKFFQLRKIIKELVNSNDYKFCFSHMSALLILIGFTISNFREIRRFLWYTHKGPNTLVKKLLLYLGTKSTNHILTASKSSFPLKNEKVVSIGHAIDYKNFYTNRDGLNSRNFLIISRISKSKNIDSSIQGFLDSDCGKSQKILIIGGALTSEDRKYEKYLKEKYNHLENVKFQGPVQHSELIKFIENADFHINNTPIGFYDKSVLETLASGIINFYQNSAYDKNIHNKAVDYLKFNGTSGDLSRKINLISNLESDKLIKFIKFSQKKVKDESLETLHERIINTI